MSCLSLNSSSEHDSWHRKGNWTLLCLDYIGVAFQEERPT